MGIVKKTELRTRFESKGFGVKNYAQAKKLSQPILSRILAGDPELTGRNRTGGGAVRRVISQLHEDGVWTDSLPWEMSA